jgi:cytochrome c oxidase subunit IV
MSQAHAGAHAEGSHATTKDYLIIFGILFAITVVEIGAIFVKAPLVVMYTLVGGLAIVKFVMVVAYFMHLKFDSKILTFLFVSGLVVATCTLFALRALSNVPSLRPETPRIAKKIELKPGDPERGKAVFAGVGTCKACHAVSSVSGANAETGPKLDGLASRAGSRKPGMTAEAYIRESIEQPLAYVVKGYDPVMPPDVRQKMDDQEYEDLVSWLLTLK